MKSFTRHYDGHAKQDPPASRQCWPKLSQHPRRRRDKINETARVLIDWALKANRN
jgi:hypothetical protein